ncbi:MAG: hypothetical protein WCO23_00025 [bacterium]
MNTEFETQILNADVIKIAERLRALGAIEMPEKFQKRWVFDLASSDDHRSWVRLRTDGEKTKICYKEKYNANMDGTKELEIEVDDFDKAYEIISKLNFYNDLYYQEDKATLFYLNDIEFKIDYWPMIPPVLEIEAKSSEKVAEGLKLLDLEGKEFGHHGYVQIFKEYGIDLHKHKILKF